MSVMSSRRHSGFPADDVGLDVGGGNVTFEAAYDSSLAPRAAAIGQEAAFSGMTWLEGQLLNHLAEVTRREPDELLQAVWRMLLCLWL